MVASWTKVTRNQRLSALEQGAVGQKEVRGSSERIEAPFICRCRVGTEEIRQNPDPREGDVVENARPCIPSEPETTDNDSAATSSNRQLRPHTGVNGIRRDVLTRDTANKTEGDGHNREGHNPVDVFGEEDLTVTILGLVHLADNVPGQVGGHSEVGNGADKEGDGKQIMEYLLPRSSHKAQAEEAKL